MEYFNRNVQAGILNAGFYAAPLCSTLMQHPYIALRAPQWCCPAPLVCTPGVPNWDIHVSTLKVDHPEPYTLTV